MSKKILFFDIDGTLAIDGQITPGNIKALKTLKENGHCIIIASGRPKWYIQNMFGELIDGLISSNGRHIEYQDEVILDRFLTTDETKQIIATCNAVACGYLLVNNSKIYVGNTLYMQQHTLSDVYKDLYTYQWSMKDIEPIYMFDVFYKDANHFLEISKAFENSFILNDHHCGSADASSIHFNKGHAVSHLISYLSLTKEDSYAFGDGANDIDMFNTVGTSVAMGNAIEKIKQVADYITDDILQDGIQKALRKHKLI